MDRPSNKTQLLTRIYRKYHLDQHSALIRLRAGATQVVPGEGPIDARVMLIGEAPGSNEDRQGRPFVGAAGSKLDALLAVAGLRRSHVFITNAVKYRPPRNRTPLQSELDASRWYVRAEVTIVRPEVIVLLGLTPARLVWGKQLPGRNMAEMHGNLYVHNGRHYFVSYHPAAAIYDETKDQTIKDDFAQLAFHLVWDVG